MNAVSRLQDAEKIAREAARLVFASEQATLSIYCAFIYTCSSQDRAQPGSVLIFRGKFTVHARYLARKLQENVSYVENNVTFPLRATACLLLTLRG